MEPAKKHLRPSVFRRARRRGVAVITALLLTTLAVTLVASLFWQQQVQVRSMENQRLHLQTKWILRGAIDFTSLLMQQDGIDHALNTSLTHFWNAPLAETRLDQYIERERVEGENFQATLSGHIVDASSRYNLTNLADKRVPSREHTAILARLLRHLQLDPALAARAARAIANTQPVPYNPDGTPLALPGQVPVQGAPLALVHVDDLAAIPGFTPAVVAKLRDFVIVLPKPTQVNVNTAPPEVLAALIDSYTVAQGNALVARRKQADWRTDAEFLAALGGPQPAVAGSAVVRSDYFLIQSRIRLDRAALDAESLIERQPGGASPVLVWVRQN
ncbi:type II secretion system minor pseudopilin GspK [Massilia glaciei]|uniref:Type II secretion system protein K n=1 Tax=Massilia glaciei TaxID=1524097 RepID=A0A2U2I5B9_9BURK|nr:type II secretion system minor pseudopilin GspK [Massilia glaciei]PWF54815.1 general secretion pathway protein GspK [Massilia glaciei]